MAQHRAAGPDRPGPLRPAGAGAEPARGAKLGLGDRGEDLAAAYLTRGGAVILERNWRARPTVDGLRGELDLVVRLEAALVAVEVKTRRGEDYGHPLEAIDEAKLRRLHRLLRAWAAARGLSGCTRRVDAVSVVLLPHGRGRPGPDDAQRVRIEHRRGLH